MTLKSTAITRTTLISLVGLLIAGSGCASQSYVSGISFYPQPAMVRVVRGGADEQSPLTVQASIEGVRRADPDRNIAPAVVAKLSFDNSGPSHVTFDPNSLELQNGSLRPFPPPQVQPPGIIDLAPGQRQDVIATFLLPPAGAPQAMSLTNLRLRWEVRIDNYPVPQTALFEEQAGGSSSPQYSSPQYTPDIAY